MGGDAEAGVVADGADPVAGEPGAARGEVRAGAEPVPGVRGPGAEGVAEEDPGGCGVAVLPGRRDAGTPPAAAVVRRRGRGPCGRRRPGRVRLGCRRRAVRRQKTGRRRA
ncbi:hypothetical protein GCM10010421_29800 [Streptomyces glaucus]|uniref:Secreted protein n=1 Tax=Streptomyces glaucus TaxID=284029 RepID=A0ABP5WWG1_9ACTN